MNPIRHRLVLGGAILACAILGAAAQPAPAAPSTPQAAGARGAQAAPPPMPVSPSEEKSMEGPVKQVDARGRTLSVGWFFGLFSTTLEVTEDTRIVVEGVPGSLKDVREGDVVEAAYEEHGGKNVATLIKVTEAEPRRDTTAPPRDLSLGATAPSTGAPKAP